MAASTDHLAEQSLKLALAEVDTLTVATASHRRSRLQFMRDARDAGWSWKRIGAALGLSDRGAARYWLDHRMEATRLGGRNVDATEGVA